MIKNAYLEELKGLSDISLKYPLTKQEYDRMMLLRDMLNIHGGEVPLI